MTNTQLRGRLTLAAISALFITPILVAGYLYFSGAAWKPAESTQHGRLITPPVVLPDISIDPNTRLRSVWSLLVLAKEGCDTVCLETLEHVRQIRLSLGPKMTRLQTVYLPASREAAAAPDNDAFPALIIAEPAAAEIIQDLVGPWTNGEIFLVDPLGNLMMSYPPNSAMGDVRKDLGHLFNLSGIG